MAKRLLNEKLSRKLDQIRRQKKYKGSGVDRLLFPKCDRSFGVLAETRGGHMHNGHWRHL